jgi:hypothetical protein
MRPKGSSVRYVSDSGSATLADLFERVMAQRYQFTTHSPLSFDEYLDTQAISLGWDGFRKPPEEAP